MTKRSNRLTRRQYFFKQGSLSKNKLPLIVIISLIRGCRIKNNPPNNSNTFLVYQHEITPIIKVVEQVRLP